MESRKIISFGSSSFVISIPKNWIQQHKLEKGDAIFVEQRPNQLIITTDKASKKSNILEKVIDASEKSVQTIETEIYASYLKNYDLIEIININESDVQKVKGTLQDLAGMEILEETTSKLVAKDLININEVSIKALMRRIDIIIRSMMDDVITWENPNVDSMYERDRDVNRLTFLARRMMTAALEDPKIAKTFNTTTLEVLNDWDIVVALEKIGDHCKRMIRSFAQLKLSEDKQKVIESLFKEVNQRYLVVMKAYYAKDTSIAHELESSNKDLIRRCDAISVNASRHLVLVSENLKSIETATKGIARSVILTSI